MRKNLQKMLILPMILIGIFTLTACSSSSKGKEDGNTKKYVIATDTTFAPFEFTDENDKFVGIDVDILAAIAEDQDFEYELQSLGFDASLTAVQSGEADGMIAGMSITDKRKETYDFSDAYYDSGVVVAVAAKSEYTSYEDLKGKTVAVKNGTEGATFAESIKKEYNLTLSYYDDSAYMYQAVLNGDADACVEDYPVIGYGIAQGNGLKMVGEMVKGSSYGFAVLKGQNGELIEKFNAGLKNIIEDGTYDEIISNYIAEK
ncbi:MAG: transporter substrate-binding domain-containing protein [Clostridiaceae bacterium]